MANRYEGRSLELASTGKWLPGQQKDGRGRGQGPLRVEGSQEGSSEHAGSKDRERSQGARYRSKETGVGERWAGNSKEKTLKNQQGKKKKKSCYRNMW